MKKMTKERKEEKRKEEQRVLLRNEGSGVVHTELVLDDL